jgi:hypothetical protein
LGVFYRVEESLHPGFFPGRGVFFDDALSGGAVDLLDHVPQGRLGFSQLFFLSQKDKFFNAGPDRAFCRLIPKPAPFTLPVTLFRRTALNCQKNNPPWNGPAASGARPNRSLYLKSEGRRSTLLHLSHSAIFFTLPFSKRVFILTSPPQEQKNFCVALDVREFLLAWAIFLSPYLPFGVYVLFRILPEGAACQPA